MPAPLRARWFADEAPHRREERERSRTAPIRAVARAKIVLWSRSGATGEAIADRCALSPATVRRWLTRVNRHGLAGLEDRPRSGRPVVDPAAQGGEIVARSVTDPQTLARPVASWRLDRLAAYLHAGKGSPLKRSRIREWLIAAGRRWREEAPWCGARGDPAFAEKRGRSSRARRRRRRQASSSV